MHETLTTTRISWNPDFINATVAFYNVSINCGEIFSEDRVVNGTTMIVDVMNQLTSTSCKAKLRALTKNGDIVISYAAFSTLGMLLFIAFTHRSILYGRKITWNFHYHSRAKCKKILNFCYVSVLSIINVR